MVMTADQYQSEESAIKRRQAIAQILMQQGQQPLETNQVAGGYVVPVSPLSAVAKIAQQLSGAYVGRKADERATKLASSKRQAGMEATQSYLSEPDRKKAAISLISNEMAPESLRGAATNEYTNLVKAKTGREGVPSGFEKTEAGIKPMPVEGYGDYAQFLLDQSGAKKQQPGYLEDEKFKLSLEDQALQRAAAARADAQLGLSMQASQRAEQAAMRQEKTAQEAKLQNVPPTHRMAYIENQKALNTIDDTIKQIESNPDALGIKNMLGDNISQRIDEKGVPVRASVANVGGVKLHDLSGAAVAPTENKRLAPLVPTVTDTSKAAIDKLKNLRREYVDINSQIEGMYSGSDYRNPIKPSAPEKSKNRIKYDAQGNRIQ